MPDSEMDRFFEEIFGYRPRKSGTSYEMLCAAAMKLLFKQDAAFHNSTLIGEKSGTSYQVDVLQENEDGRVFGEAKDYTVEGKKVGRPDLQKLVGALVEVAAQSGRFFSATDFTGPARRYAGKSEPMIGKRIDLTTIRPSTEEDEDGRVRTIILKLKIYRQNEQGMSVIPMFTDTAQVELESLASAGKIPAALSLAVSEILNCDGSVMVPVASLDLGLLSSEISNRAYCTMLIPGGHILIEGLLFEIHGLTFDIPYFAVAHEVRIEANGKARLLVRDESGQFNKLVTDVDLKTVKFGEDGAIALE